MARLFLEAISASIARQSRYLIERLVDQCVVGLAAATKTDSCLGLPDFPFHSHVLSGDAGDRPQSMHRCPSYRSP